MSQINDDLYVNGTLTAKTLAIPNAAVADAQMSDTANLNTTKMRHKHRFLIPITGTPVTVTIPAFVATANNPLTSTPLIVASIVKFAAGLRTACVGDSTVVVDLQKAGSSILSSVITLSVSSTAKELTSATLASATLVVDDWLDVVVTVTAGTGTVGTGLLIFLEIDESAV